MPLILDSLNMLNSYASIDERLPRLAEHLGSHRTSMFAGQEVLIERGASEAIHRGTSLVMEQAGLTLAVAGGLGGEGRSGNAIWYRAEDLVLVSSGAVELPLEAGLRFQPPQPVFAVFTAIESGSTIVVFSVHLAWGAENGAARLGNARRIEATAAELVAQHQRAIVLMAGDFNTRRSSSSMQFLRGETALVPGTFWIDVWEWLNPDDPGITQVFSSKYAAETARGAGIFDTSLIPDRRIDYVMLRGWSHTRLGAEPQIELWGNDAEGKVSDHLGLSLTFDL